MEMNLAIAIATGLHYIQGITIATNEYRTHSIFSDSNIAIANAQWETVLSHLHCNKVVPIVATSLSLSGNKPLWVKLDCVCIVAGLLGTISLQEDGNEGINEGKQKE